MSASSKSRQNHARDYGKQIRMAEFIIGKVLHATMPFAGGENVFIAVYTSQTIKFWVIALFFFMLIAFLSVSQQIQYHLLAVHCFQLLLLLFFFWSLQCTEWVSHYLNSYIKKNTANCRMNFPIVHFCLVRISHINFDNWCTLSPFKVFFFLCCNTIK